MNTKNQYKVKKKLNKHEKPYGVYILHPTSLNFPLNARKTAPNGCENVFLGEVCKTGKGGGEFVDFGLKI